MHRMHIDVKPICAWRAADIKMRVWQTARMAPIKKPKHNRARTFLREWREHRALTLEEAAERMDIHYTTLLRIERGQSPYNQDFLERAALAYGCEPTDLLDNNPNAWNVPKLVYDAVKAAPAEKQRQALEIIAAFLKAS